MAEDSVERAISDAKENARNVAKEARGAVKDVAGATTDAVKATADSFERVLRRTIETQPYTAVMIGVGIGWLLGRTHRPF
jgi:ElaB/YqjD/DUF883 family membrane-anchored ribosome-binding protein